MTTTTPSTEIPRQHKAAVYDNPGNASIKIKMVDTPKPVFGGVLVDLTQTGVCHSNLGIMTNSWNVLSYPIHAGQVGGPAGTWLREFDIKLGDRVGIKWVAGVCGSCLPLQVPCLSGSDGLCLKDYRLGPQYNSEYAGGYPSGISLGK
ncbi:uncharacterized protein EURHEDRAFT_381132 [Aspergillus ruber CBS 135680]|uniref:Uncharacterized protein n=1 Tax=Aspergillus ruber (strain CBS 135680) TaxID=1388766 RepID=A0A017S3Q0_ASPRC|nr:uncharacterized protein EURHEDRAFT_381132 [Aspergillus ruber CBS 135680]EYE91264.1 hypothetical protein EURHEDRAFT_381132 [Aspergillus ruber CBS 135680]